ncbi:dihydroorotase [Methanobrevibacter sp. DSM 116169]|uniref:dihydroorotase n=1 Tax=Methanobrevibacter sp. DSM 116169 TaxID=3242727 RepID=UPI0038FCF6BC
MNDLLLKNCKLVDKQGEYFIGIKNGKINSISKNSKESETEIDIKGNIILPGLIDPHVHFRDPGLTYKEDFKSGSLSAAHGGFTTVIDMPNTKPQTNTYENYKEKLEIANSKSVVNFKLHAGTNTLEEMEKIAKFNPPSFKIFLDLENDESLEEIFKNLGILKEKTNYNGLVTVHCEKKSIADECTKKEKEKNENNAIDYSYARPSIAEDESIKQAIKLANKNNLKLHICHLSSKKGLEIAKNSKNVSWEYTPHHLLLDNNAYNSYGTIVKTNPPLREFKDKIGISDMCKDSIIGTDHAPHTLEEKNKGVWNSAPGIPNLETVLPLLLTEVNYGNLDLKLIPKILSYNPSKIFGFDNKGEIAIGKDADITVIDLKKEGKFDIDSFYTKARYTPFKDFNYKGHQIMTIINGKIVVNNL